MNGLKASLVELSAMAKAYDAALHSKVDLLICPPSLWIAPAVSQLAGSALAIGAQDCHFLPQGAHTGDISALMIKDAGASHVIVGHSERRTDHGETSALVKSKAEAVNAAGLVAIVCVGETQAERQAGRANEVVGEQLQLLGSRDGGGAGGGGGEGGYSEGRPATRPAARPQTPQRPPADPDLDASGDDIPF
jgi:triosephosphate isomerase